MRPIPAIPGFAHRHADFVGGFVMNRTFMGLLGERITCVG